MASIASCNATLPSVANDRPALGPNSSLKGLPCRFSRTTARVALSSRQPAFSLPHKHCKAVRVTAAATPTAAATTADDSQGPHKPSTLAKLLSGLRHAAAVAAFAFMASRILTGPGAMLAAYYTLQVVAPALALRKAFKLSTLEALIGSLTLVRVAWMLATRYILPPSALIKTHVTFTSSAMLPAFLQRYLNGGFYAPGLQPFGIEQIPLVDTAAAGLQAGLALLGDVLLYALEGLLAGLEPLGELVSSGMTVLFSMAIIGSGVVALLMLGARLDKMTGGHVESFFSGEKKQQAEPAPQKVQQQGLESGGSAAVGQLKQSLLEKEEEVQRLKEALKSKRRESLRCAALEREVSHDKKTEQRKLTKLHEEIQQLTADNCDFAAKLGEAQQEVATWKEQAEKACKVMEWAERRMRIEEDAAIKLLRAEVNKLKHSVNVEEEEVELLGAELERTQASLKDEKAAVAQLSAKLVSLKSSVEEKKAEIERLYKEHDLVQSAHKQELEEQRQAVDMLVAEKRQLVQGHQEHIGYLEHRLASKEAQVWRLVRKLEEIEPSMADLLKCEDDSAQPALEAATKSEESPQGVESPQDTLAPEQPVAVEGQLVLQDAPAPEETAPDSSHQVNGLVDFVGRVEGMDFVVLDASKKVAEGSEANDFAVVDAPKDAAEGSEDIANEPEDESEDDVAFQGMDSEVSDAPEYTDVSIEDLKYVIAMGLREAVAKEHKGDFYTDRVVDGRGAYLRAEGYGFPELAREWDKVAEAGNAQDKEAARAELAPEAPAAAEEEVSKPAEELKDNSVQSFAVDVELDEEYKDEEAVVKLNPGLTAEPTLTQGEPEQKTFTVGIEMAEEEAPEQPVKGAVEQSVENKRQENFIVGIEMAEKEAPEQPVKNALEQSVAKQEEDFMVGIEMAEEQAPEQPVADVAAAESEQETFKAGIEMAEEDAPEQPVKDAPEQPTEDAAPFKEQETLTIGIEMTEEDAPEQPVKGAVGQSTAKQEDFTVGIEMAEEEAAPEQPVEDAVEKSVAKQKRVRSRDPVKEAAATEEQGVNKDVATAAAETRQHFLQTMRHFRDAKEQQAKELRAEEQLTTNGFKDAKEHQAEEADETKAVDKDTEEQQEEEQPVKAVAVDKAAEEPQAEQIVTEGDHEKGDYNFVSDYDEEDPEMDCWIEIVDVDAELEKEASQMPTERDYDEQDWADQVESRPGSYRFVNKNRKSKGKKRNR